MNLPLVPGLTMKLALSDLQDSSGQTGESTAGHDHVSIRSNLDEGVS